MMTPGVIAAHQAADRDLSNHLTESWTDVRDLYVRAFLAGAQWQQSQESPLNKVTYGETTIMRDGELPSNAPDSRTASTDREDA